MMGTDLAIDYRYNPSKPAALLNSIFMLTVNTAAKTLVAVASSSKTDRSEKWRLADHFRFMVMLMTWLTVWVLRVLVDHFPFCSTVPSHRSLLGDGAYSTVGSIDVDSPLSYTSSTSSGLDLILHEGSDGGSPSVNALGRALSHVFVLLNEIPASSRKYQFAVAMADKILDENSKNGHVDLLHVNHAALSLAFSRTTSLLNGSLQCSQSTIDHDSSAWPTRFIKTIPLGSYMASYVKGLSFCLGVIFPSIATGTSQLQNQRRLGAASGGESGDMVAEKHAQELLWLTNKMRAYGAVEEAVVQWSLASGLASLSLAANPRVQGFIVKISAILFGELTRGELEVARQVKFRLLVLWLPLFCYADNGFSYPVLTGFEKAEMERTMDQLISSLPAVDQEVILSNWLQDFTISSSDWPNLQLSYDRWCHSTRKFLV